MAEPYPKDTSKLPGGYAGGKASAERPEEDRRESSRKAADTRHLNQVGPGIGDVPNQPQSYNAELRGATWKLERDGDPGAVRQQLAEGDREAEAINAARDAGDPDYSPDNPAEEQEVAEMRGKGVD